eukprot:symbB.v1.2.025733.t1/scaffold2517.1/size77087/2
MAAKPRPRGAAPPPFPCRPGRLTELSRSKVVVLEPDEVPVPMEKEKLPPLGRWIPPPDLDLEPPLRSSSKLRARATSPSSRHAEKEVSLRHASMPIFRNVPHFDRPQAPCIIISSSAASCVAQLFAMRFQHRRIVQ